MTELDWKAAARNLMAARLAAGFASASEGARQADVPQRTYSDHERGVRPFLQYLDRYAKAYNTTPEKILYGDRDPRTVGAIPHLTIAELENSQPIDLLRSSTHANALSAFNLGANLFTITNPDRAMQPGCYAGDILCFDADTQSVRPEEKVLARIDGYGVLFRIYSPQISPLVKFIAANPAAPEITVSTERFWLLGRFRFLIRAAESID